MNSNNKNNHNNSNRNKKNYRKSAHRFNPAGMAEAEYEEIDFTSLMMQGPEDSFTIVEKLQSYEPRIREMATISLAQMENFSEEFMAYFIEKSGLKLLIQRLVDPNPQIILNSLMALANIVESNIEVKQKSIGDVVLENGVLVILESMLTDFKKAHEERQIDINNADLAVKIAIVDYSYKLLSGLAEVVCDESIDMLVQSKVTLVSFYFVMHCDDPKILTGIGSYLQILTESSVKICQYISENLDFLRRLVIIIESNGTTQELKAYLLGSVYNYIVILERNGVEPASKVEICEKVVQNLLDILGIKIFEEIDNLMKIYEDNKKKAQHGTHGHHNNANHNNDNNNTNNGGQMESDPINHHEEGDYEDIKDADTDVIKTEDIVQDIRLKQALGIWSDSASAIHICLGILINMFETEDAFEDNWEDNETENEEEQSDARMSKYEPQKSSFMENMTHEIRRKFLENLFDKCSHISEAIYQEFQANLRTVIDQGRNIIEFSLSAMTNILLNLEYSDKKNKNTGFTDEVAEQIFKMCLGEWKYYLETLYSEKQSEEGKEEEEESDEKEDTSFEQKAINDIIKIMNNMIQASSMNLVSLINIGEFLQVQTTTFDLLSEESKLATIELIGTRCHPKFNITVEENAMVGDFLLVLLKSDNIMVIGEALDALFDVYSDESYDTVFVEKGFMNVLIYGYDVLKGKISQNRDSLTRENIALMKNHLLNLKRFIKYKQEHIK